MACIENVCKNGFCLFRETCNIIIEVCPMCGGRMAAFFDEQYDNESPRGDDYEEVNAIE